MIAHVLTPDGLALVDLDEETVLGLEDGAPFEPAVPPPISLPLLVAAAGAGSTVVAVVKTKPPLVVSHDAGATWRESGRGLPEGRAVAVSDHDPDLVVFAARNRLYVSRDGGVFWTALAAELPEIDAVAIRE